MPPKKGSAKASTGKRKKDEDTDEDIGDGGDVKEKKTKTSKTEGKMNPTKTKYNSEDFICNAKSPEGRKWNLKISSWNINGIRALIEKNGLEFLKYEEPDIFCVQETKCANDKLPAGASVEGYKTYWLSGDSEGYSGVGLYTKIAPLNVKYGIGNEKHDQEGRVITAEYEHFYLVAVYVPNAGRKLVRLDNRMEWDGLFRDYLMKLDKTKPVILCGDLNVAHQPIDLANPKGNKRNAGFTQEERDNFTTLLESGFVDSFRHLHPDMTGAYTFWTYMMNARAKDVGWRLDYFVLSQRILPNLCESLIRKHVLGSDHCPVTLLLAF